MCWNTRSADDTCPYADDVLQIVTVLSDFSAVFGDILSEASTLSTYLSDYTTNSSCPTDNTAGGILGPSIGALTATVNVDSTFYSWVGCNCSVGTQERKYTIDTEGEALERWAVCVQGAHCPVLLMQ